MSNKFIKIILMKASQRIKLIVKIFFGTITVIAAGFLICAQINICTYTISNYSDHSHFFRNIVTQNNDFKEVPLTKIAMLASHDSLSNDIGMGSKPNTNETTNPVNNPIFRGLAKGAIVRLSRAQNDDVYAQLNAGCRFIDLRITHIGDNYYNSHGLISNTLENNLLKILMWLDENPGEFIIFDIVYFYDGPDSSTEAKDWNALVEFMKKITYKGKSIIDYDYNNGDIKDEPTLEFKDLTYKLITDDGSKAGAVLMTSTEKEGVDCLFTKHGFKLNARNATAINSDKAIENMITFADEVSKTEGKDDYLIINETQTQPGFDDRLFGSLFSWSLLSKAHEHNTHVLEVLKQKNLFSILETLPIYMCDYSTSNDTGFNDAIIKKLTSIDINLKKSEK